MKKTANVNGDYRYRLGRYWDNKKRNVLFIGLNPSTADAYEDDATIRRLIGFSKDWGFGGLTIVNLFAYRSTDPKKTNGRYVPRGQRQRRPYTRRDRTAQRCNSDVGEQWELAIPGLRSTGNYKTVAKTTPCGA